MLSVILKIKIKGFIKKIIKADMQVSNSGLLNVIKNKISQNIR